MFFIDNLLQNDIIISEYINGGGYFMNGREMAYGLINELTEKQFDALMVILQSMHMENQKTYNDDPDRIMGIFHDYADASKIPLENDAWSEAAAEKHLRFLEEMKNGNP